jgi:hypothetical protein
MKRGSSVPRLDEAIGFHPSIRFVVTADKDGTILDAVKRRGVVSLEPSREMKTVTERFAIGHGLSRASEGYYGRTLTIIVRREKLVELVFPIGDKLVIVSATPRFPLGKTGDLEKLLKSLQTA